MCCFIEPETSISTRSRRGTLRRSRQTGTGISPSARRMVLSERRRSSLCIEAVRRVRKERRCGRLSAIRLSSVERRAESRTNWRRLNCSSDEASSPPSSDWRISTSCSSGPPSSLISVSSSSPSPSVATRSAPKNQLWKSTSKACRWSGCGASVVSAARWISAMDFGPSSDTACMKASDCSGATENPCRHR